jgi:MYXO-CTERM domain-containing protein
MRCQLALLVILACSPLVAQYTVTSGALSSPYASLSNNTPTGLMHNQYSATPIAPPGFSFPFFGGTFTSFQAVSAGYITFSGLMQSVPSTPTPSLNGGLVIAPLWSDLAPGNTLVSPISPGLPVAGDVSWNWSGGVLGVEWRNVPLYNGNPTNSVGVRMKLLLDTATGVIEFQYGSVPGGTTAVTSQFANAVCIADIMGIVPQVVIPGHDVPNVGVDGSVAVYPANRYIRFTPSGPPPNTAPTIAVDYDDPVGGPTSLAHQGTITVPYGHTVAALAIDVGVDDVDQNDCSLAATVTNAGSTGVTIAEWQSASAPVPYSALPASGTFNTLLGASHLFTLTANDGTDNTVFSFTIVQDPAPPVIGVAAGAVSVGAGQGASGTNRDFGTRDIAAGATAALTITIANTGGSPLSISNFMPTGDTADFDVQSGAVASAVAPGATTSFTVAFDPATVGAKALTVSFDHGDTTVVSPFDIEFLGDAVQIIPVLVVREGGATGAVINHGGTIGFGSLDLAQSSGVTRTIFIQNTGNGDLTVDMPASGAAEFLVTATGFPAVVPSNGSITFTVTFQPTANGPYSGAITFDHNDLVETNPFSISMSGTAVTTQTTTGGSQNNGGNGCATSGPGGALWVLVLASAFAVRLRREKRHN